MEENKFEFFNVVMYRAGEFMGGIHRQTCKSVEVTMGVKYAQYDDAVKVQYLEKGKRKPRAFVLCGADKWLRICDADLAIQPDATMVPGVSPSGMALAVSRYASHDPRYLMDFEDKAAGVRWLVAIGAGDREGEYLERCKARDEKAVA